MRLIWTDGSCDPNPGPGGWGWHDGNGDEHCGGAQRTTNNRMEMQAILEALRAQPDGEQVLVHSDSQYCVNGLTIWRQGWKRRGWKRKDGDMPNRDLWLALEEQINRLNVFMKWVRGHNGDANNELADELASRGRLMPTPGPIAPKVSAADLLSDLLNEGGVEVDSLAPWQWDAMVEKMDDILNA